MVRIYVEGDGIELPMDFEPEEALDIANELRAAAEVAMATAASGAAKEPKVSGKNRNGGRGPDEKSASKRGSGGKRG
jgi:hypothetical protein